MPFFKSSLRRRLIVSSLLVMLVSLGVVAWLVQLVLRQALEETTHQTLENQVVAAAQSLNAFFGERRTDVGNLADTGQIGSGTLTELSERLDRFQRRDPSFETLYQLASDGRVIASTRREHIGRQIEDLMPEVAPHLKALATKRSGAVVFSDYANASVETLRRAESGVVEARELNLKVITSIRDREGKPAGSVIAVVADAAVAQAVAGLKAKVGREGDAYLLTTGGRVLVAHGHDKLLLMHPDWEATRLSQHILDAAIGSLSFTEPNGSTTIASYALTDDLDGSGRWILVAESPYAVAMAPVMIVLRNIGGVLLVALLLSVAVAFFNARRVLAPLDGLVRAADAIRGGTTGTRVKVPREAELAAVALAFNQMVEQRELATVHLERNAVELARAGDLIEQERAQLAIRVEERTAELSASAVELARAGEFIDQERAQLAIRVEERTAELSASKDKLEATLRGKSTFLATMSHEIRTPINGLMGTLELLSLTALELEQQEMLRVSREAGTGLLRIIDDILDYSKIEAGKMTVLPIPTSVGKLVARAVSTFRGVAGMKGLSLGGQVDPRIGASLMVDPTRLSQILNNFVSNAVKFTQVGTVALEAVLVERTPEAERVRFTVTDSGIGIDPKTRERLFGAYEQGALDTGRLYGGTGLGLSICQRLAELMGGELALESEPGKGARFSVTFTLAVAAMPVASNLIVAEESATGTLRPAALNLENDAWRVLCADDHDMNRRLILRQLAVLGVRAEVVNGGEAALAAWREGEFDLLITDCHMPDLDGYALARAIRAEETSSGRARIPIIAWTANAFESEIGLCLDAGMDACLSKPCDLQKLRDALLPWARAPEIGRTKPATSAAIPKAEGPAVCAGVEI